MSDVKATRKKDFDELKEAGDFLIGSFEDGTKHICFICPCGCGDYTGIRVGVNVKPEGSPTWQLGWE